MSLTEQALGEASHVIGTFDITVTNTGQRIGRTINKEPRTGPRPKRGQVEGYDLMAWSAILDRIPGEYKGLKARVGIGSSLSVLNSHFLLEPKDKFALRGFIQEHGPLPKPNVPVPVGPYRGLDAPGTRTWDTNNGVAESIDFVWEAIKELVEIMMSLRNGRGYIRYRLPESLQQYQDRFDEECNIDWSRIDPRRFRAKMAPFVDELAVTPLTGVQTDLLDDIPCLLVPELASDAVEFILLLQTTLTTYVKVRDSEWRPDGGKKIPLDRPYCALFGSYDEHEEFRYAFLALLSSLQGGITNLFGGGARILDDNDVEERFNTKSTGLAELLGLLPR